MKTFLICPVRGHELSETEEFVKRLENKGWEVYWPPRNTNQDDPIGYQICLDNKAAIQNSDVVHVIWDGQSQGCLFDLGMAFAMNKKIIAISLPERTQEKSFQNMILEWQWDILNQSN